MIIPDFNGAIVGAGNEVRLFASGIVFDAIDAFGVAFQREIGLRGSQLPHFHQPIQRSRGEGVVVFGIEYDLGRQGWFTISEIMKGPFERVLLRELFFVYYGPA